MTECKGPQTPHVATRGPAADSKTSVWLQRGDEVPPRADGDHRRPLISPTERRGRRQSLLPCVESRSNSPNPPARPGGPRVQITSSAVWAAHSHLFPHQIDGETEGKINGFLSRRSQLCRVWEFDVTPSIPPASPPLLLGCGKIESWSLNKPTDVNGLESLESIRRPVSISLLSV